MTPRRSETHRSAEVMFCSLFSGKITWRKRLREFMCRSCCQTYLRPLNLFYHVFFLILAILNVIKCMFCTFSISGIFYFILFLFYLYFDANIQHKEGTPEVTNRTYTNTILNTCLGDQCITALDTSSFYLHPEHSTHFLI